MIARCRYCSPILSCQGKHLLRSAGKPDIAVLCPPVRRPYCTRCPHQITYALRPSAGIHKRICNQAVILALAVHVLWVRLVVHHRRHGPPPVGASVQAHVQPIVVDVAFHVPPALQPVVVRPG